LDFANLFGDSFQHPIEENFLKNFGSAEENLKIMLPEPTLSFSSSGYASQMQPLQTIKNPPKEDIPNQRKWALAYANPLFMESMTSVVQIETKHRREKKHLHVDKVFYSSIQYQTFFSLDLSLLKKSFKPEDIQVDVRLLNAQNGAAVSDALTGPTSTTMHPHKRKRKFKSIATGELMLHVDSKFSYHFTSTDYKFEVSFTEKATGSIMCSYRTPSIRYYARKKNKRQYYRDKKKRQREASSISTEEPRLKRQKKNPSHSQAMLEVKLEDVFQSTFFTNHQAEATQMISQARSLV